MELKDLVGKKVVVRFFNPTNSQTFTHVGICLDITDAIILIQDQRRSQPIGLPLAHCKIEEEKDD